VSPLSVTITNVAQAGAALATILLAFLTYNYVRATRDMVREMREGRLAQDRPYVIVDLEYPVHTICDMVVRNIGHGTATEIQVSFDPDEEYQNIGKKLSELRIFRQLHFLVPNREFRFFYKQLVGMDPPDGPSLTARVRYKDTTGREFTGSFPLDPFVRWDLHQIEYKHFDDLVKSTEQISKNIDAASRSIAELEQTLRYEMRARSSVIVVGERPRVQLISKLAEIREFWRSLFEPGVKAGGIYHSPSLFQARLHRFAADLISLADAWPAKPGDDYARVDKAFVGRLAEELFDMSAMPIRMDGGRSLKSFQERGDATATAIDEALTA
jgi:hypothetical protein